MTGCTALQLRHSFAGLVLLLSSVSAAQPVGRDINPGVLGANALPPTPTMGPWVDDTFSISVGNAVQLSWPNRGTDISATLPMHLEVPVAGRFCFWADGSPFELFQYSPQSVQAWSPSHNEGGTRADVSIGTRLLVTPGFDWVPAIGVRIQVKTATGEDLANRRFLDAPAYQFDLLVGQRFTLPVGQLEFALSAGFLAWQQGQAGQNDAFAASLRVSWRKEAWLAFIDTRGYGGWEKNDAPVALALGAEYGLHRGVFVWGAFTQSFLDPLSSDLRLGLRFTGDAFESLTKPPSAQPVTSDPQPSSPLKPSPAKPAQPKRVGS